MGRGWKRARKLRAAPVPYPTRVLPGAEAEPAAEVVRGHQPKRGSDPDLDSTDRHPVAQVFTSAFPVPVVAFQPGGVAAPTTVCLPGPLDVNRRPVPAATRVAARTAATALSVPLSRTARQLGRPHANLIPQSPHRSLPVAHDQRRLGKGPSNLDRLEPCLARRSRNTTLS